MKIYLASDHAGFELKDKVKSFLLNKKIEVVDCGDFSEDKNDDYPDFIAKAAEQVSNDPTAKGIVFGKSGSGEEIVANKFKNIRAIIGFSAENVKLARKDNDANILSLGSQFVDETKALELVDIFLDTQFSNAKRHKRRIDKISNLE